MTTSMNLIRPEPVWPVDEEYSDKYDRMVAAGRETAKDLSVAIVAIARNSAPYLANTLALVDEVREGFGRSSLYFFENDSVDGTAEVLDQYAAVAAGVTVEHESLGGADSRGFEPDRTVRLAYCRNKCHDHVRTMPERPAYTIVMDTDPHHGFSVDGVFNSVAWLGALSAKWQPPAGMASYSLYRNYGSAESRGVAHYDAWAMRLNWWRDRRQEIGMTWAFQLFPPVGSNPIPMYSAFGGLCVYSTEAFLAAGERPYQGGDCEHVFLHKKMHEAGYQLYLNPGSRYVAIWQ